MKVTLVQSKLIVLGIVKYLVFPTLLKINLSKRVQQQSNFEFKWISSAHMQVLRHWNLRLSNYLSTSVTGNSICAAEFALIVCSEALSADVKSSSFSLLRPPYSTGRFSGAMILIGF